LKEVQCDYIRKSDKVVYNEVSGLDCQYFG